MDIPKNLIDLFNSYLFRVSNGCLIYTGGKVRDGYGWFNTPSGFPKQAHRFAYLLANGKLDENLLVCHTCDNPACCEPGHLFQGTHQDNSDDCVNKGRGNVHIGTRNPNAKLTDEQVLLIRKIKSETNCTYKSLSAQFGVTPEMVSYICRRIYRNDI
jgi:hypothetical protein